MAGVSRLQNLNFFLSFLDVPSQLGIFIAKTPAQVSDIKKVLVLYNGLEHEHAVFQAMLKMKPAVNIEVFTPLRDLIFDGVSRSNITVVSTGTFLLRYSGKRTYRSRWFACTARYHKMKPEFFHYRHYRSVVGSPLMPPL